MKSVTFTNGKGTTYTRNAASGDLTQATLAYGTTTASFGYAYDAASELASQSISDSAFMWRPRPVASTACVPNALNQHASVKSIALAWEANGNLMGDGVWSYG